MADNVASLEIQVRTEDVRRAELRLKKLERAGRPTARAAEVLERRINKLNRVYKVHHNALEMAVGKTASFNNKTLEAARVANRASSAILRASKTLDTFHDNANRASGAARRARSSIHQLNGTLGSMRGVIAGLGIGLLARHVVEMGTNFDRIRNTMHSVFGSVEAANEAFLDMRGIAMDLGADIFALADMYAQMSAASAGTALQGEATRDIFLAVAETATVLRFNLDQTRGVIKAFEQMISKGTVQAEELRNQLGDRLPGAFNLFVRAYFGVETATEDLRRRFNDLMRQGQLVAAEVLPRVAEELRRTFGPGLEAARRSAQAEMNRMVTAFRLLALSGWENGFEQTVINVSNTLRSLFESENVINMVNSFASALEALTSIVYRYRSVIVPAVTAMVTFASVFIAGRLLQSIAAFIAMASGGGGILGILALLAALASAAATAFGFFGSSTQEAVETTREYAEVASNDAADANKDLAKSVQRTADRIKDQEKAIQDLNDAADLSSESQDRFRSVMESMNWVTWTASIVAGAAAVRGLGAAYQFAQAQATAFLATRGAGLIGSVRRGASSAVGMAGRGASMLNAAGGFGMAYGATMDMFNRNARSFGSRMIRNSRSTNVFTRALHAMSGALVGGNRGFSAMMRNGVASAGILGAVARAAAGVAAALSGVVRLLGGPIGIILGTLITAGVGSFLDGRRLARMRREGDEILELYRQVDTVASLPQNREQIQRIESERDTVLSANEENLARTRNGIAEAENRIRELQRNLEVQNDPSRYRVRFGSEAEIRRTEWLTESRIEAMRQRDIANTNRLLSEERSRVTDLSAALQEFMNVGVTAAAHFQQAMEDATNYAAFDEETLEELFNESSELQFRVDTIGMDQFETDIYRLRRLLDEVPILNSDGEIVGSASRSPEDTAMIQGMIRDLQTLRAESRRQSAEDEFSQVRRANMTEYAAALDEIQQEAEDARSTLIEMAGALGLTESHIMDLIEGRAARQIEALNEQFSGLVEMLDRVQDQGRNADRRLEGLDQTQYQSALTTYSETIEDINEQMREARELADEYIERGYDEVAVTEQLNAVLAELNSQKGTAAATRDRTIEVMRREVETVDDLLDSYRQEAEAAGATEEALADLEYRRRVNERLQEARDAAAREHDLGLRGSAALSEAEIATINSITAEEVLNERRVEKTRQAADEMRKIWEGLADDLSRTFTSVFDFTRERQSISEFLLDVIRMVNDAILEILRVQLILPFVKSVMRAMPFLGGFEKGGVFNGGSVMHAYAKGTVVSHPTTFGMVNGGIGLMGESGPEAVVPLSRGRDGKLGISMHSQGPAGFGNLVINQTTNVYAEGGDADEIAAKSSSQTKEALKGLIAETVLEMSTNPGRSTKPAMKV